MKVILVGAAMICGRISPPGYGSRLDRRRLEEARDQTQASIMGANTLRTWDPEMRGTGGVLRPDRIRAVISQSGPVPVEGKRLFRNGPKPVVFTSAGNTAVLQAKVQGKARVVSLPEGPHGLSLAAAIEYLSSQQVEALLIEGGGRLNYSALAQGVVDEILLTILPMISGDRQAPAFVDGPESLLDNPFSRFELLNSETVATGEIFLHYKCRRAGDFRK